MPLIDTSRNNETGMLELARSLVEDNEEITKNEALPELLRKHRLDTDHALSKLSDMIDENSSPTITMRGIETALKLNKVLDSKETSSAPVFIINITDPKRVEGINPILLPRELQQAQGF